MTSIALYLHSKPYNKQFTVKTINQQYLVYTHFHGNQLISNMRTTPRLRKY